MEENLRALAEEEEEREQIIIVPVWSSAMAGQRIESTQTPNIAKVRKKNRKKRGDERGGQKYNLREPRAY
mgnify:CR=1 FL=1